MLCCLSSDYADVLLLVNLCHNDVRTVLRCIALRSAVLCNGFVRMRARSLAAVLNPSFCLITRLHRFARRRYSSTSAPPNRGETAWTTHTIDYFLLAPFPKSLILYTIMSRCQTFMVAPNHCTVAFNQIGITSEHRSIDAAAPPFQLHTKS